MNIKLLIVLCFSTQIYASGFNDNDGAPIRQGVHIEWYRTIAPGYSGEGIFVWSDTRYGMRNIFAHKIDQDGNLLWGEEGTVVTDLPGRQEDPVAITDGAGGAFIAWVDYRFDAQGDIFFQHVDNTGEILLDSNGVALAQVEGKQITINMCTDSLGGVFITWQDKRSGVDDDIYGTHVSSDHVIVAPGNGVPIVTEGGNQNAKTIEYAGNNQAFIAWADFREGANADIYGQRLNMDMTGTFQDNGFPIAATNEQELKPRATYINNNTSFLAWKRGDENSKVLYQFINQDGMVFSDPKPISNNLALQTAPRVKRNSLGEVFVNWKDLRDDPIDGDQYFQKINVSGDQQWGDGIRLDPVNDVDFSARFTANTQGGVSVVWERGTFPDVDIFFQNITSEGSYSLASPYAISENEGYQFSPILSGNEQDGIFAIYADQGSGSIDLVVQKFNSNFEPEWGETGLVAMAGLDGDVNYTNTYRLGDQSLLHVWEDNRASKKIYGNKLINLNPSYSNGIKISFGDNSSSETDFSLPVFLNASSGMYTATFDGSSSPKFIRINRLNEDLTNAWDPSGVALNAVFDMRSAMLVETSDGVGCMWSESRGFNYDIYYQKLDVNGNFTLDDSGVELVSSNADDYMMSVVPTPDGKFMIFWMEDAWPASSLKFTKIDSEGNIEIGWNPNGNSLSNPSFDSRNLTVKSVADESGVLAIWTQDGNFSDIYAQMISWDGEALWNEGGIAVSEADNDQVNFSFEFNESKTHALVTWEDYRNGTDFEIFGEVIDLESGSSNNQDVQFSNDTTNQYNPTMALVQNNEFLVIWEDERGYYNADPLLINGVDLYGSGYIIGQGMTTNENGIPICIAYHKQQSVNITKHVGEEYFLDWVDYRSSGKEDLANYYGKTLMKATLLSSQANCSDCTVPKRFNLESAYPNPFNGQIYFDFNIPGKQSVTFTIYDLSGRKVYERLILPSFGGKQRVLWDGSDDSGNLVSSGVYLYKFISNKTIAKGKITYLK